MPLFRSHRSVLKRSLTSGMRLLLPADPGADAILDAARLFDPAAEHAGEHRIVTNDGKVFLGPPCEIDADMRRAAGLAPDVTVACFVHSHTDVPLPAYPSEAFSDRYQNMKRELLGETHAQATCLINGLATRFNGTAYPVPKQVGEPLHAAVYTAQEPTEDELAALVSRHAPGLAPVQTQWSDRGVITWHGDGSPFDVEYWPPPVVRVPLSEFAADGSDSFTVVTHLIPASGRGLHALVVRAAQPAHGADPGLARALGQAALGLAADTDGVCMDLFGFRVLRPDDLIVR